MGEIKVRRLDDRVLEGLRSRARAEGVSLEEQVRRILTEAVDDAHARLIRRAAALRALSGDKVGSAELDSVRIIREERDAMG